jgi:hypothetical protein
MAPRVLAFPGCATPPAWSISRPFVASLAGTSGADVKKPPTFADQAAIVKLARSPLFTPRPASPQNTNSNINVKR